MKKIIVTIALLVGFTFTFTFHSAYAETANQQQNQVQLTEQQKAELSKLYREMLDKKKEIIAKKLEFGMITKEKADKMNAMMEEHFKKMEENNFMYRHHKMKDHHQHHQQQ